jgi:hypothetical protein
MRCHTRNSNWTLESESTVTHPIRSGKNESFFNGFDLSVESFPEGLHAPLIPKTIAVL